jgi:hypothetical protein
MKAAQIRELGAVDAEPLFRLRRHALLDAPLAFAACPEDDLATSVAAVRELLSRGRGSAVFGAFHPELVGMLGLYRDRHVKAAHKVHLWGMGPMFGAEASAVGCLTQRLSVPGR